MTEHDRFDDFVKSAVNELDPMPVVPRDEMWARIDEARRFRRSHTSRPQRRISWVAWPVGLAATLAIGIGLGRMSVRLTSESATRTEVAQTTSATDADRATGNINVSAYDLVARQHFSRAEVLLTAVSSGAVEEQMQTWANDMLINTRLLLDSPAARDPQAQHLLQDLELLLTQIAANTPAERKQAELNLIQHGIEETDVLPRLRAAQPVVRSVGA